MTLLEAVQIALAIFAVLIIFSFIAMALIASAYFFKSKEMFLVMQGSGIFALMGSYLFNGQYFAMIGLGVGLLRCIIFFAT